MHSPRIANYEYQLDSVSVRQCNLRPYLGLLYNTAASQGLDGSMASSTNSGCAFLLGIPPWFFTWVIERKCDVCACRRW